MSETRFFGGLRPLGVDELLPPSQVRLLVACDEAQRRGKRMIFTLREVAAVAGCSFEWVYKAMPRLIAIGLVRQVNGRGYCIAARFEVIPAKRLD